MPFGTAAGAMAGDRIMRASIRVRRCSPEIEGSVASTRQVFPAHSERSSRRYAASRYTGGGRCLMMNPSTTRRRFLQLGGVSLMNAGLLRVLAAEKRKPAKARACILLFQ